MPVASIENGLDMASLTLLDWDHAITCDFQQHNDDGGCKEVADWKVFTSCCGMIYFFCDPHFEVQMESMKDPRVTLIHPESHGGCGAEEARLINPERIRPVGS